jgi:hypothetical protein
METTKRTRDLYQASYWLCMGGKVMGTIDNYPKTEFSIKMNFSPKFIVRRIFHWIDWKDFKKNRLYLKKISVHGTLAKTNNMKGLLEIWERARKED